MKMGRVFYFDGNAIVTTEPGWYYQIDMAEMVGPFDKQLDAGIAARAAIGKKPPESMTLGEFKGLVADGYIEARAKTVARVLNTYGFHISEPDEGNLDDAELERWAACVAVAKALER